MLRSFLTIMLISSACLFLWSQTPEDEYGTNYFNTTIGYFYDIDGQLINQELDLFYTPKNPIMITQKIGVKKVDSDTVGEGVIAQFDGVTFYLEREVNLLANGRNVVDRYFLQTASSSEKVRLGSENGFGKNKQTIYESLEDAFPNYKIPQVIAEKKKLGITEMNFIINLIYYEYLLRERQSVKLNEPLELTDDAEKQDYYMHVDSMKNGVFYISNRKANQSIVNSYEVSHENPNHTHGWETYYWSNGNIKTKAYYKKSKLDSIVNYSKNGKVQEKIYVELDNYYYIEVYDQFEKNVLDPKQSGSVSITDESRSREITKEYIKGKLKAVYFTEDERKIYLYSEQPIRYKFFDKFYGQFLKAMEFSDESDQLKAAYSLVLILVNENAVIEEVELLRSVNPELDIKAIQYFNQVDGKKVFLNAEHGKNDIPQYIVLAIQYQPYLKMKQKFHFRDLNSTMWTPTSFGY